MIATHVRHTRLIILVLGCALITGRSSIAQTGFSEVELQPDGTGWRYSGDVLKGDERDAFVNAHNATRKELGLPPVEWSDEIAAFSLEWIHENRLKYNTAANEGKLPPISHRPSDDSKFKQKYGENIAVWGRTGEKRIDLTKQYDPGTVAPNAVALWLKEKPAFEALNSENMFRTGDEANKTDESGMPIVVGHYTQMIWKGTTRIGAARWVFRSADAEFVVIVCNYDPPGNITGKKPTEK